MKKILVTGAAGFMASHIVDDLIKKGHDVYGVDDMSGGFYRNINPLSKFTRLDLSDSEATRVYIENIKPEYIYHLSASAHEGASQFNPLSINKRNYQGFINLIVPAIRNGLKKFICFSSMAVYGNQEPPFAESFERKPVDIYGINKASMEQTLEILAEVYKFNYIIIRPHNVIGERQNIKDHLRNVAGIFMNRILRGEPLFIYGDGKQLRAFSGIDYSLPCYLKCLDVDINSIFNIGGKYPITVNHLAYEVCKAMGENADKYKIVYLPDRPREVKLAYTTYEKSEHVLGYQEPKDGWIRTVHIMAEWAKRLGPQDWEIGELELINELTPKTWLSNFNPMTFK